jgi:TatA/E family protein of Tat protein translocase
MLPILAFGMPAAPEWIFIGILALVLFGPKRIPEIARGLGKALGELQRAKEDFHREISGVPPLPKIESPAGREISGKPLSENSENVPPEVPEDHNKAS